MRYVENPQLVLGEDKIARIQFDPRSRDDIPQLLRGLQHLYLTPSLREQVFAILETAIPPEIDPGNGRPGMELWKVLVLGSLRLSLNCDYDRVHELANNHKTLRQMLGHGWLDDDCQYSLQTIKDNVRLLTPELLDQINQVVVKAGHQALKKSPADVLKGRCDSFVVETDVHYPTDITLLFDASRQVIERTAKLCIPLGRTEWRQSAYQVRQLKRRMREIQKLKCSRRGQGDQQAAHQLELREAHAAYLAQVNLLLDEARRSVAEARAEPQVAHDELQVIEDFMAHAHRQASQIMERVLWEQAIPHEEKVFSVYEPHTEWISKGKAGVPVELGLKVCVMEDQHGFILHHQVMVKSQDVDVAQEMVRADPSAVCAVARMQLRPRVPLPGESTGLAWPARLRDLAKAWEALTGAARVSADRSFRAGTAPACRSRIGDQCPRSPWAGCLPGPRTGRIQALCSVGRREPESAKARGDSARPSPSCAASR